MGTFPDRPNEHAWCLLWNTLSNLGVVPRPGESSLAPNGCPNEKGMCEHAWRILRETGNVTDAQINAIRLLVRDAVLAERAQARRPAER